MCTLVLLLRPGHRWPLLIAANRDERVDRPSDPPAAWWPEDPCLVGGRDQTGGGTWLAVRPDGMVAAVLNRTDSLGPAPGFRSRGALPLLGLQHEDPAAAAAAMVIGAERYRPFNLVLADRAQAWFVRGGPGLAETVKLMPGLHMITARDPDDLTSRRTARHLPRLRAAPPPSPPDWSGWTAIMADRTGPPEAQINIAPIAGFGTVSASRVAVPHDGAPQFTHAPGPPDRTGFVAVDLPPMVSARTDPAWLETAPDPR